MKQTNRTYVTKVLMSLSLMTAFSLMPGFFPGNSQNAKAASVTEQFSKINGSSTKAIDHSAFSKLLKTYVKPQKDGLNRVNYKAFKSRQSALKSYIKSLEKQIVTNLSANEQFAFWANLYNAITIDVVLDAYPVQSIKDIDISPGLFSNGPWGKKLVRIEGTEISLDDIEHQILRKVYKDPRVHYAVNCASIGCPNVQTEAFKGAILDEQLNQAAIDYINSNRGIIVKNNEIAVSKIYSWFKKDFGNSNSGVLAHLKKYAKKELRVKLAKIGSIDSTFYDWTLNDHSK